jgi:hypothetical protein
MTRQPPAPQEAGVRRGDAQPRPATPVADLIHGLDRPATGIQIAGEDRKTHSRADRARSGQQDCGLPVARSSPWTCSSTSRRIRGSSGGRDASSASRRAVAAAGPARCGVTTAGENRVHGFIDLVMDRPAPVGHTRLPLHQLRGRTISACYAPRHASVSGSALRGGVLVDLTANRPYGAFGHRQSYSSRGRGDPPARQGRWSPGEFRSWLRGLAQDGDHSAWPISPTTSAMTACRPDAPAGQDRRDEAIRRGGEMARPTFRWPPDALTAQQAETARRVAALTDVPPIGTATDEPHGSSAARLAWSRRQARVVELLRPRSSASAA